MMHYTYTIRIEPAEEGGFIVTVPALPGCVTQGETYEEAVAMAQECIEGFLEALEKAGQPIPREAVPTAPVQGYLTVKAPVHA
jgi:antitoxin HicB